MKTILITGANSEIAYSYIKKAYHNYDAILALYAHRRDRIDKLCERFGDKIIPIATDLGNKNIFEKFIEKLGNYEVNEFLHIAAPRLRHLKFAKSKIEEFELEMQVVYWSFLKICRSIIPNMVKKNGGQILAILTEYTITTQPPYLSHYISSKFALLGLIRSLATEYGVKGIHINGISPGMIETDFISALPQYVIDDNAKLSVRGKNLNPNDLVPTISYLLSETSVGINGQNILLK